MMIATVRGRFRDFEGTIEAAEDISDSKVMGIVRTASIDTNEPTPFCAAAQPNVREVRGLEGDSIRFAFRHFPLSEVHQHAKLAAEAAEAAGAQGRFWHMHELLFANQRALMPAGLLGYATATGLDVAQVTADLERHRYAAVVREHFLSGLRRGVNGTPAFFVNGLRHDGGYDLGSLLNAVTLAGTTA